MDVDRWPIDVLIVHAQKPHMQDQDEQEKDLRMIWIWTWNERVMQMISVVGWVVLPRPTHCVGMNLLTKRMMIIWEHWVITRCVSHSFLVLLLRSNFGTATCLPWIRLVSYWAPAAHWLQVLLMSCHVGYCQVPRTLDKADMEYVLLVASLRTSCCQWQETVPKVCIWDVHFCWEHSPSPPTYSAIVLI